MWEGGKSEQGGKKGKRPLLCPFLPERVTNQQGRSIEGLSGPGRPRYLRARREYNGTEAIRPQNPLFSNGHSQGGAGKAGFYLARSTAPLPRCLIPAARADGLW